MYQLNYYILDSSKVEDISETDKCKIKLDDKESKIKIVQNIIGNLIQNLLIKLSTMRVYTDDISYYLVIANYPPPNVIFFNQRSIQDSKHMTQIENSFSSFFSHFVALIYKLQFSILKLNSHLNILRPEDL